MAADWISSGNRLFVFATGQGNFPFSSCNLGLFAGSFWDSGGWLFVSGTGRCAEGRETKDNVWRRQREGVLPDRMHGEHPGDRKAVIIPQVMRDQRNKGGGGMFGRGEQVGLL
jgi:hypothetical protein